MKLKSLLILSILFGASFAQASPQFWQPVGTQTPTPPPAPNIEETGQPEVFQTATPTAVTAPRITKQDPTPTPEPGLTAKNPTEAAIFSVVVPGAGQVYAGDPLKGLVFATLFGVSVWQTIDKFQLVPDRPGSTNLIARDETLGNFFGLAAIASYGFGVLDAYNTAANYNRRHYLTLNFGITPRPNANLAFLF
jgi:hypothetical protein